MKIVQVMPSPPDAADRELALQRLWSGRRWASCLPRAALNQQAQVVPEQKSCTTKSIWTSLKWSTLDCIEEGSFRMLNHKAYVMSSETDRFINWERWKWTVWELLIFTLMSWFSSVSSVPIQCNKCKLPMIKMLRRRLMWFHRQTARVFNGYVGEHSLFLCPKCTDWTNLTSLPSGNHSCSKCVCK